MKEKITVEPIDVNCVEVAIKESEQALVVAQEVAIVDQGSYQTVCDVRGKAKGEIKKLNAERKDITKDMDSAKKKIMDLFRKPISVYEKIVAICSDGMLGWDDKQEKIRKAQQEKLERQAEAERKKKEEQERVWREKEKAKRKEAERLAAEGNVEGAEKAREEADKAEAKAAERGEAAESVVAPVIAPGVEKVKGTYYTTRWYGEVTDLKVLMKAILDGQAASNLVVANDSAIDKTAQATKGTIVIPGVEIRSKKIPSSRQ